MRSLILAAAFVVPVVASAAPADVTLKVDFGDKDKGKPESKQAGQVTASGRVELSKEFAEPKVVLLLQRDGEKSSSVYEAELKDGKWTITVDKLDAGTYHVRARCAVRRTADDKDVEVNCPADLSEPTPYKVEVKGK